VHGVFSVYVPTIGKSSSPSACVANVASATIPSTLAAIGIRFHRLTKLLSVRIRLVLLQFEAVRLVPHAMFEKQAGHRTCAWARSARIAGEANGRGAVTGGRSARSARVQFGRLPQCAPGDACRLAKEMAIGVAGAGAVSGAVKRDGWRKRPLLLQRNSAF
jgi:hypothetical protein